MLNQERKDAILSMILEKGTVSVTELTKELNASESTIRRDLLELSNKGELTRVHGGATIASKQFISKDETVLNKQTRNIDEKIRIAKYAASLINDDDFVFIDAGTTTLLVIDYIDKDSMATFVTNGVSHAKALSARGFNTVILGGHLKSSTEAIVGIEAAAAVQNYNFTKAFMGVNGISELQGYTTPDVEEAYVKRAAIDRSFVSYVLADHTKFGKVSSITISKIDRACIITDAQPDERYDRFTVVKVV